MRFIYYFLRAPINYVIRVANLFIALGGGGGVEKTCSQADAATINMLYIAHRPWDL